jgi:hypothetical protein
MNGLTRLSLSLTRIFRNHSPVYRPVSPSGKRRPCRPLLQPVVVFLPMALRVGRSIEIKLLGLMEQKCNTTRF